MTMDLKTRYKVKGLGIETTITSVVTMTTNEKGKIVKVQDKWNGKLPNNAFMDVSFELLMMMYNIIC